MSQKQKAKLKKRAEHQHRNELRKLELFNAALRRAGLSEAFHRILPEVRNGWRGMMLPVPEIVLDASAADCEQARGIQKQMPQFLRIPIAGRGQEVSAVDMVCVLIPLKTCADTLVEYLRRCGDNVETGPGRHVVDFATQMGAFMQRQQNLLLKDFTSMVWMTMVYNTRIDERVFWSKFANRQTPGERSFRRS